MQKNEFVVCNCCGRKFFVQPDKNEMEIVHVEKEWGYFSRKDTTRHIFDLCEERIVVEEEGVVVGFDVKEGDGRFVL